MTPSPDFIAPIVELLHERPHLRFVTHASVLDQVARWSA